MICSIWLRGFSAISVGRKDAENVKDPRVPVLATTSTALAAGTGSGWEMNIDDMDYRDSLLYRNLINSGRM